MVPGWKGSAVGTPSKLQRLRAVMLVFTEMN
jgi:hypothetical protein